MGSILYIPDLFFCLQLRTLTQDLERVIEEARRQAKIEAHSSLGGEAKRIAGENKRMAKELRFQMQVLLLYKWAEGGPNINEKCTSF